MRKAIERHRNILDFTLASLVRRKWKNIALFSVYTLIVFLLSSVLFLSGAFRNEAALILENAPELIVQRMSAGRHQNIPVAYTDKITGIKGISSVSTRLWGYYYDPVTGANYTLVVGDNSDIEAGNIAVGEGISRTRFVSETDTIEFKTYKGDLIELVVSDVFPSESGLVSSDLILISEKDFRELFGTPKEYATDLILRVRNPRELPIIAQKVAQILPDTRQVIRDDILRTYDAVFNWRSGILIAILFGSVLAFIIFSWDKASGLSGEERREIGILKAIGWETADIIRMKFWEGLVVSLSSFLLGLLLAYIHVFFGSFVIFEPVLKGWAVLYPHFEISHHIDGAQVLSLFFITVVPYTVATIIPAWRAAIIDPDSVMR